MAPVHTDSLVVFSKKIGGKGEEKLHAADSELLPLRIKLRVLIYITYVLLIACFYT